MDTIKNCTLIEPFYVSADTSVVQVARKLRDSVIRQIFVVDADVKPIGIISTTDMTNRVCAEGKDPNSLTAKDIMSSPIEIIAQDHDAAMLYRMMSQKNRLLCAVVDADGTMKGMITISEVLRAVTGS